METYLIPHNGQIITLNYSDDVNELCSIDCIIKGTHTIYTIIGHIFDRKSQSLSVVMEKQELNSEDELIGNGISKVSFDAVKQENIGYFTEMSTPRMIVSESKMSCNGAFIFLFDGLMAFDPATGEFLHGESV